MKINQYLFRSSVITRYTSNKQICYPGGSPWEPGCCCSTTGNCKNAQKYSFEDCLFVCQLTSHHLEKTFIDPLQIMSYYLYSVDLHRVPFSSNKSNMQIKKVMQILPVAVILESCPKRRTAAPSGLRVRDRYGQEDE